MSVSCNFLLFFLSVKKYGITEPLLLITFPYLTILKVVGLSPVILFAAKNKLEASTETSTVEKERNARELEAITQSGNQLIEKETNEDLKFYYKTYFKFSK